MEGGRAPPFFLKCLANAASALWVSVLEKLSRGCFTVFRNGFADYADPTRDHEWMHVTLNGNG